MAGMENKRKLESGENAPLKRAKMNEVIDLSGDEDPEQGDAEQPDQGNAEQGDELDDLISPNMIELDDDLFKQLNQLIDDDEFEFSVEEIMRADREREEEREQELQELRDRVATLEKMIQPNKKINVTCPFCPFTSPSGEGFRPLKLHLASGKCSVPIADMVHTCCKHPTGNYSEGDSGLTCLKKAGFKNPYDIENEFYRFKCDHCNYRHWHKTRFNEHVSKCQSTCSL